MTIMQIRRRLLSSSEHYPVAAADAQPQHILEKIVWCKEQEVSEMHQSLGELQRQAAGAPAPKDFMLALKQSCARPSLIAEVKKASPSRGIIRADFDPVQIAKTYERSGAACLSVLCDHAFFQGSFDYLQSIRKNVALPLLCKEFIIDPCQIYQARAAGADAVLLIAAILSNEDLRAYGQIADSLGMATLVEVHTLAELNRAITLPNLDLLGINNRNLQDFTVTLQTTQDLMGQRRSALQEMGIPVVSESGIHTRADLDTVAQAGAEAVLVGESLMKQADLEQAVRRLFKPVIR